MDLAFVSLHFWLLEHAAVEKEIRDKKQDRDSRSRAVLKKTSAAEEGDRIAAPILAFELRVITFLRSTRCFHIKN